jgi:O-antigen ligase
MRWVEEGKIPAFDNVFFDKVHNDYLQGLFEFGFLGMGIVFLGLGIVASKCLLLMQMRNRELAVYASCLTAVAVNAVGNFPLHVMPLGFLACFFALKVIKKLPDDQ